MTAHRHPTEAGSGPAAGTPPVIRRVEPADLPTLLAWLPAGAARSLPDPEIPGSPARESWWVAHHGEPAVAPQACLRVRRAIGLQLPRFWYHRGCVVHAAPELQLFQRQEVLLLGNDLTGLDELADLAWDPALSAAARQALLGGLIDAALHWLEADEVTDTPHRPGRAVLAELPGWTDDSGRSPFWQGLGRHFYQGDPGLALQTFGPGWVSHLAALLPRQAVYTAFLEPAALMALGRLADRAWPAAQALRAAGFLPGDHVRVDDGGPVLLRHMRLENLDGRQD